jgi:hypothetical protein
MIAARMPENELKELILKVMGEVEEVKGKMNIELLRLHYLHEEMEKAYRIKSD